MTAPRRTSPLSSVSGLLLCLASTGFIGLGCGASNSSHSSDETTAAKKLVELRAERRRDRMRMRQLEERMATLARQSHDNESPRLPVERLAPAPDPSVKVVGIADDGAEIVYVGEAAQSRSVAAGPELLVESRPRKRSKRPAARAELAPVPTSSGTLGVTRKRLPKVTDVTRRRTLPRARELPSPRARRRRPLASPKGVVGDYQANVALLRAGKHDDAVRGFRRFVRRYARSDYADNAQYWLGEAFYDRKQFAKALVEFERVERLYPTGNKVPDAKLKAAFCKLALGDVAGARALLTSIAERYPNSRLADLAQQKLERLKD